MADVADVVIIGGGCTGTSTAWQLAKRRAGHIVLLEKLGLAMGATGRSSAIVRMHYTHEAPTRLAQHSLGIFERFGELVGGDASFRQTGCLVLVGERDLAAVTANVEMHQRVGVEARVV